MKHEIKEAYDNDPYILAFSDENGWIDDSDLSHKLPVMPWNRYDVEFYVRKQTVLWRPNSLFHLGEPIRFMFSKQPNKWDKYLDFDF